jgi:hypothetical protein
MRGDLQHFLNLFIHSEGRTRREVERRVLKGIVGPEREEIIGK